MMREFADMLGHPERDFRSIHITGSNGKGSTSAFIYSILRQKFSVGVYTSPHLERFNERIIVDNEEVPDEYIDGFIEKYRPKFDELSKVNRNPTFFEVTTMMAFQYFKDRKVDYASVEVGLGGRLDATNIIMPEVSVIAQVGYEHADKLGCSLTSIAYEKAGIIKEGRPIVLQDDKPEVVNEVRRIAQVKHSPLITLDRNKIKNLHVDENGTDFDFDGTNDTYHIHTSLIGDYQALNAATAILAVENSKVQVYKKDIETGISRTIWPGRLEIIDRSPLVIIDAAHNPPAANKMVRTVKKVFNREPTIVAGILSDKDAYSFFSVLRQLSGKIIFTTPEEKERAVDPNILMAQYGNLFRSARVIPDPISAFEHAKKVDDFVFVTGSIYLIGVIRGLYDKANEKKGTKIVV
ncbi:folylpolyglutamate synthase [Thermoplasma volcanium GSS1]|uniref:Folylpolyglutamate synthase n=1 Tax=Thermoplasma volcanium (strain ATCC 51530 / DSM 4299 / JCM 9571 / NBRC 15438 / GSS1) TaxID=273116 RepID=Q97AP2_THEVO|nr:folylpolyglutamate synthase [Thermoplasma volcanium GSS1]